MVRRLAAVAAAGALTALVGCQPNTSPASSRCDVAVGAVHAAGLGAAPGFAVYCPGSGRDVDGTVHQGLTSWNSQPDGSHLPGRDSYVDVNPSLISTDARLRHVVAHEFCHSWDYARTGTTTETAADACASAWGFP